MAKRSKSQLARDRRKIADLYLQGVIQADIADQLTISQATVSRDLKALQAEWQKSTLIDVDAKKGEELAKVDRLEREYWRAWKESCEDAETVRQEATKAGGVGKVVKTAKGQSGDPRYLSGVQWCINKRCEILGLDAPKKQEHSVALKAYATVSPDDWDEGASDL